MHYETTADKEYKKLLTTIMLEGNKLNTRNHEVYSHINLPNTTFTAFPLVTFRKTAVFKAISEMEWFMSGDNKCPDKLLDWWKGQLNSNNRLVAGYPDQLRSFISDDSEDGVYVSYFDQVKFILDGLKNNPNSRRLLMTVWNPEQMANITELNSNPNTPTCCHSIIVQFFVRSGVLHMKTYARSQDMLLGVPHNWVQSWAMLLYFAYHSKLEVGTMTWMWGDAHIYNEETHIHAVNTIMEAPVQYSKVTLVYNPTEIEYDKKKVPIFKTSDFTMLGSVPEPIYTNKITLL